MDHYSNEQLDLLYGIIEESVRDHTRIRWERVESFFRTEDLQFRGVGCMMDYMGYTPRTPEEILRAEEDR